MTTTTNNETNNHLLSTSTKSSSSSNEDSRRDHILKLASVNDSTIIEFDDGHIPETTGGLVTKLVNYSRFEERPPVVHVVDDVMPSELVDAVYQATVKEGKPWGTYVTIEDAMKCEDVADFSGQDKQQLAVAAAARFLKTALQVSSGEMDATKKVTTHTTGTTTSSSTPLWTPNDNSIAAHGVAVWALASTVGAQVPYHLDYAEQIRYQYNLIVPPLLAGTSQCTRAALTGGDFGVYMGGMEHYLRHGYKGGKEHIEEEEGIVIPYHYNRLTLASGHLPHGSTPIKDIADASQKRVVVGFNVFGHDFGPLVQAAPEHSDVFRRQVKVQRALQQTMASKNNNNKITLELLTANKGLSKLLVLAKRERVKLELARAQEQLDTSLEDLVRRSSDGVSVETCMKQLACSSGSNWPSPTDVQVHINQRLKKEATEGNKENTTATKEIRICLKQQSGNSRMVQPSDVVYLAK